MWNNVLTKRNPKQPDFKCKDKACDGVIWPPKNAVNAAPVAAPAKVAHSAGPHIPGIDGPYQETGAPPADATLGDKLSRLFTLYDVCLDHAIVAARKLDAASIGSSPEAVAAMCATLYISAKN